MQDRVPLYPGRVKLTPVAGQENVYDMVRADQPTQEGTPLNKNSLLKDATAALFQLSGDTALPDKVFEILSKAALVGEDGNFTTSSGANVGTNMVYGTYTGDGTATRTLSFSREVQLLVVNGSSGDISYSSMAIPKGSTAFHVGGVGSLLNVNVGNITWNGTSVSWGKGSYVYDDAFFNKSGQKYEYVAFLQ